MNFVFSSMKFEIIIIFAIIQNKILDIMNTFKNSKYK